MTTRQVKSPSNKMLKRTKSMFEISPDHSDTIVLGRCLLSATTVALLSGYSSIAIGCSVPATQILKRLSSSASLSSPTSSSSSSSSSSSLVRVLASTEHYWIVCLGSGLLSLMSWVCLAVLGQSSTKFWILGLLVQKLLGVFLSYFLYLDMGLGANSLDGNGAFHDSDLSSPSDGGASDGTDDSGIRFLEVHVKILEGRDLVAKDRNIWGRAVSSDPYVKLYHGPSRVGRTHIVKKTLNPQWTSSNNFQVRVLPQALDVYPTIECQLFDHDHLSADDSMGLCTVKIPTTLNCRETKWIKVEKGGEPGDETYCHNAKGELKIEVEVRSRLSRPFRAELHKTASQRGGFLTD